MNQTDEFAASLLIVRQTARLKIDFLEGLLKQETGCVDCSHATGFFIDKSIIILVQLAARFSPSYDIHHAMAEHE